jgi:ribosomal protein L28
MATKTTSPTTKRKASGKKPIGGNTKTASQPAFASASTKRVVAQNLINMVVVMAGSVTVLLGLLAAKHFQIAQF